MNYKPTYTKEEVEELVNWFDNHKYANEVDLGYGLYVGNVAFTLNHMRNIALTKYENRSFSGQVQLLFKIREELIKQDKVTDGN